MFSSNAQFASDQEQTTNASSQASSDEQTNDATEERTAFSKGKTKIGADMTAFIKDGISFLTYGFDYGKYLANNLYVDGGLDLTCYFDSGYQWKESNTSLGIPLSVGYTVPIFKNFAFDLSTGPRFNYIISGKYVANDVTTRYSDMEDIDRFWADWDCSAFFNIWGFRLGIKYQIGLTDNCPDLFGIQIGVDF